MKNKTKVLHLLSSEIFSGAENVACSIILNLNDKYDMIYCSPKGEVENIVKKMNIKFYTLSKNKLKSLKKIIKEFNPDIIHAHDYTASCIAALSGFDKKIISHLHNNCPFAKSWNLKTILYSLLSRKFYKVIGVSDKVIDEAIFKKYIKDKYTTLYNCVDKEKVLQKSNEYIFDKSYDVFFVGRLTEQKNPFLFIEIVKRLKQKNNSIKAVMLGEGTLKQDCMNLIEKYDLIDNIDMLGFVENPYPIMKNSKISVITSNWEGFGLIAIEALILNKIVINSGVGGLGEIFRDDKYLICKTVDEYVDKIENFKYKLNFNKIINRYCDKDKWISNLIDIYK